MGGADSFLSAEAGQRCLVGSLQSHGRSPAPQDLGGLEVDMLLWTLLVWLGAGVLFFVTFRMLGLRFVSRRPSVPASFPTTHGSPRPSAPPMPQPWRDPSPSLTRRV